MNQRRSRSQVSVPFLCATLGATLIVLVVSDWVNVERIHFDVGARRMSLVFVIATTIRPDKI